MDVVAKYQAEHERVRKWLEEQGISSLKQKIDIKNDESSYL
jgi:hypothetical protein